MAEYKLTQNDLVVRMVDLAWIPNDPLNTDRQNYVKWLADGGVPDPADPPVVPENVVDAAVHVPYKLAWIDYEAGQRGIASAALIAELKALLP
jgi:hypothetical protein